MIGFGKEPLDAEPSDAERLDAEGLEERFVTVDGASLRTVLTGDPSGPPLVLLHGGMGSVEDFAAVIPLLADRFRLIGVDSRGHGRSTLGRRALAYPQLERDVVAVLDALGLARVALVGFSDGGIVAYRLAIAHPDRVAALVTIGADWKLEEGPVRDRLASVTPASWRERFPSAEAEYTARNPEPDFDGLVTGCVTMWTDPDGYPGEAVAQISAPLTIVRGADDPLTSHTMAVELQRLVPQAELIEIDDAAHAVAATHPTRVAEIIRAALG